MKRIFTCLVLSFIVFGALQLDAQKRYIDEVFTEVSVESDVVYGTNATVLLIPVIGTVAPEELKMDIYQPVGDTETNRPMVLVFHTGNFLPPVTNAQISGSKVDSSAVEICKQLARRGFVAASVDYRLGWNPLAETQPERALGLIQAAYRGVQDGLTAIRYIKNTVANGNQYGVNPDQIVSWGNGTGGYISLAMASLDEYGEIVNTTNGPGKFLLDADGDGTPETPMVVPAYHGDIEGKVETIVPMDGFGLMAGWQTNYPNWVDESSDFAMSVNVGGACGDLGWIDEATKPIITVQSPFDIFAPYGDAVLVVPTTNDPIVQVQGGSIVIPKQHEFGNNDAFANENYNDAATELAASNSVNVAMHDYYEGLFPFVRPVNSGGLPEGVVIDWWDPTAIAPGVQGMGMAWEDLPHPSDPTGMTSFHEQGLLLNEGMSAEKARTNIAEIMAYVLPRMCVGLGLGDCVVSNTNDLPISNAAVSVSPNPTQGEFTVTLEDANNTIESIRLVDLQGKVVATIQGSNTQYQTLDASNLNSGMYILQIKVEDGVAISRISVE